MIPETGDGGGGWLRMRIDLRRYDWTYRRH